MKLLFLVQGHTMVDHPGWTDALEKLKAEGEISGFLKVPVYGYASQHGWKCFYDHVVELCRTEKFDVVYFHYFHRKGTPSPRDCIAKIRHINSNCIVVTSAGDPFADNWMKPGYPRDFKDASRCADVTFSTQMGKAADKIRRWGGQNVVYTPNSMCQARFKAMAIEVKKHRFEYDVVFVGSRNAGRFNPMNRFYYASKKRLQLVTALSRHFGKRFGLFGKGWDGFLPNCGPCPFDEQQHYFRKGRIVVGGNPYSYSDYYSSNRIFFEIASGVPTVELSVPRLDKVLRNGDHVYFADDIDQVIDTCERLLKMAPEALYAKAAKAARYVAERHTQYHRMLFKINTIKRYLANGRKLDVEFPFFLDEVDLNLERLYAVRTAKGE
jgi:spore maturation protein CgeB